MLSSDVGVFVVDKPQYFTSFDVVAKLRGILKIRRIGHGGTLDPLATGVLPIFIGKATKAVDLVPNTGKRYIATAKIGCRTDSGDITGSVIATSDVFPNKEQLENILSTFLGMGVQIPPMYSAIKVNGRPLYDIARKGEIVKRQPRPIEIFSLDLLSSNSSSGEFTIDVACSKGTYIRTLVEDIAEAAGSVATLTTLKRTKSGPFDFADCMTLKEIEDRVTAEDYSFIAPVDRLFDSLKTVTLSDKQYSYFLNGVAFSVDLVTECNSLVSVVYEDKMIAVARILEGELRSVAKFLG